MSLRAQTLGAAGVIVDGRVRDLQEHRDLGFPVCYPFKPLLPSIHLRHSIWCFV
jgi:regulator of RNase E activity RraA